MNLFFKTIRPFFPSTYKIVFVVSIGVNKILYKAALAEAPIVLIIIGKFFVESYLFIKDKNNVLAKVSPNLERGP